MDSSVIIRFVFLGLAWLATVGFLLARSPRVTAYTVFIIVASAIIVFVPMYKKYVNNGKNRK